MEVNIEQSMTGATDRREGWREKKEEHGGKSK